MEKYKKIKTAKDGSDFIVPIKILKQKESNEKIFIQINDLILKKPKLYDSDPIEVIDWAKKIVNLYKLLK